jgi:hypothetical protein
MDFLIIQSISDLSDISEIFAKRKDETYGMECSELVRFAPNNSDVYFAHNTWSEFRTLTLVIGQYDVTIQDWIGNRVIVATNMGPLLS